MVRHNLPSSAKYITLNVLALGRRAKKFFNPHRLKLPEEMYAETLGDRRRDLGIIAGRGLGPWSFAPESHGID
jgi:hypothetical protein